MKQFKDNVENNNFKACFFTIDTKGQYHEAVEYIYNLALAYEKAGIETYLIHEEEDYKMPEWLGEEYVNLSHDTFEAFAGKISLSPSDIVFLPEVYTEILQQLIQYKVPAELVVIIQQYERVFDVLEMGQSYNANYGVKNVIVPTQSVKNHLQQYMHGLNYHVINPYIKDFFKRTNKPKTPMILMADANTASAKRVVQKFYLKYPQYAWVPFKMLTRFHINQMKEQYEDSQFVVFLDDKNAFCLEQLQAMSMGAIPIAITPKLAPDWLIEDQKMKNIGVYTQNDLKIVDLLAYAIDSFLTDKVDESIYEQAVNVADEFRYSNFNSQFNITFEALKQSRLELFKKVEEKQKELELKKV